jgi:uncharacterized membrane protein (DUF485 family)
MDMHQQNDSLRTPEPAVPRNTRIGLILFVLYLLFYGGFMVLNAFWPTVMSMRVFAGVNLAIVYGLALIVVALVLAVLYGWLCRSSRVEGRS